SSVLYLDIGLVDAVEFHKKTSSLIEQALIEATEPLNDQLKGFQETVELQRQEIEELKKDKNRLGFVFENNGFGIVESPIAPFPKWLHNRNDLDSAISKQKE